MIRENCHYVDKTAFIKPVMTSENRVLCITRPRRFGKTLFLSMLRTFLAINWKHPGDVSLQEAIFSGLKIRADEAFCQAHMGRFPVLSVTMKNCRGASFEEAVRSLAAGLWQTAAQFAPLMDSPALLETDRCRLRRCMSREFLLEAANRSAVQTFLTDLSIVLARHFGRPVVLLVDEYDVPLWRAEKAGYGEAMLSFLQGFFRCLQPGGAHCFEEGRSVIRKTVLTGCLPAYDAVLFAGIEGLSVDSVCSPDGPLSSAFGFASNEVEALLADGGLASKKALVMDRYDGYQIGKASLCSPWDVIHFCRDVQAEGVNETSFKPGAYWADTAHYEPIDAWLDNLRPEDADKVQRLCGASWDTEDGFAEISVNRQMLGGDVQPREPLDDWTLLLFAGYFTVVKPIDDSIFRVRIPNKAVLAVLRRRIEAGQSRSRGKFVQSSGKAAQAMMAGNAESAKAALLSLLARYVAVRDSTHQAPADAFYRNFLTTLLRSVENREITNFESKVEVGDGKAELLFTSVLEDVGVVIELKHCSLTDMHRTARGLVEAIREKRGVDCLTDFGCDCYRGVGIAFSGRSCAVEIAELTP